MKKISVIMAGGSGERFWPLSRTKKPKQLLNLADAERNMLQMSIDRIKSIYQLNDIFIITSKYLQAEIRSSLSEIPQQNIIAEPSKRNTAPCLALAAGYIIAKYNSFYNLDEICVSVLTADQIIQPIDKFSETIQKINNFSINNDAITTIGIIPERAETGFGYIEIDPATEIRDNLFPVLQFKEKPNLETAQKYLKMGNFLWNSGMFFYRLDVFVNQMKKYLPDVGNKIDIIANNYKDNFNDIYSGPNPRIQELFELMPDISIDYGLMEKTDKIYVMKSNFYWDDLGSWDSLFRIRKIDENGNIIEGNVEISDVRNSIIINKSKNKFLISAISIENVVIINTDDSTMISPIDKVQNIKNIVKILKEKNKYEWL